MPSRPDRIISTSPWEAVLVRAGSITSMPIPGVSDTRIATHPSDMCMALAMLEAQVHVSGACGDRVIAFADFHRLPGGTPRRDASLSAGEIITTVELPP
jgi:xanthine dehydrogenase YagS FAD-binding subunit